MENRHRYQEYDQFTDEELIDRLRGGEEEIMDYICDKVKEFFIGK